MSEPMIQKVPLTDSQLGIYLECAANPESIKYNIPFTLTFTRSDAVTPETLKACTDRVIAMHPALYSCIRPEGEQVYMCRQPMPEGGIVTVEYIPEEQFESFLPGFVRPYVLDTAPLCRGIVLCGETQICLLMDIHHLVSDGSSISLLAKQIGAALSGEDIPPEEIDAFAISGMLDRLEKENAPVANAHFAALLGGVETDSNLLPDCKSDLADPSTDIVFFNVENIPSSPLRTVGVTHSSLFMSAFGYTLAKMTGQKEALFTAAESGRKVIRAADTVLMMVRTVPVYMPLKETGSPLEQVAALQKQFYTSIQNDTASFAALNRAYGVTADVMFVYQSNMLSGFDTPVGKAEVVLRSTGSAVSNLSCMVFKQEGGFTVRLEYRTDRYRRATVERFAALYRNAVKAFAADAPLKDISLLSDADRGFLDALNRTDCPYNTTETVVDIFRRHVKTQPDKVCVRCEDRSYTYAEADSISGRVAAYIRSLGIGRGQVVSVLIPRGEYMLLISLGVMKAGAVYQPLDPSYPPERLSFMRKDASSALLIADRSLLTLLPDLDGKVLCTDEFSALPQAEQAIPSPRPEDGYILLYTSGTTGLPKGCMLRHSNLMSFMQTYANLIEIDGNSTVGAYASYGFDANMADMYPVLSRGGTLVIIPDSIRLDLPAIKAYMEGHGVTHQILTTQLGVQFVSQYKEVRHLKYILSGGEKMVSLEPPKSYRLVNAYGPTECTVMETAFTVDKVYEDIPIGKAIDNTRLYAVDPFGRRVPVGVPGELIIAGPQVSHGYLNRPEQTVKAFVPNTFEPDVPEMYNRCYRTGDIVRFTDDGNLYFIGRRDMQVKIRGFRVELSEVERVIMDYPGVKTATVIAADAPSGGKCLHAYIVGDAPIDIGALNAYIRDLKPPYMVPAATMQLDSLPLTVNGKVDKRKLPKMEVRFDDITKPENEVQQRVYDAAVKAVGTGEFGIRTDLFEAGLSSLGSIRLCTLLAEDFNIHVQIRDLKKYPTVEKLEGFVRKEAGLIDSTAAETVGASPAQGNRQQETGSSPVAAPAPVLYGEDHPISKTMEGIFTECVSMPGSTVYNIPYLLKLGNGIDESRLTKALAAAVEAHPYMKTELFTDEKGRVRQHQPLNDTFTAADVDTVEAQSIDALRDTLVRPFGLTNTRLFRVCLIHTESLYLLLDFHHIISDGTAMNIFIRDVEKAYAGETLTEETYTGFDVAEDEQTARNREDFEDAKNYYATLLEGRDRSFLPLPDKYAHLAPASGTLKKALVHTDFNRVKAFCQKNRVSVNGFFTGAFGFVLSRYAGTDSAVFNTVYNGRNDSRAAETFAMLVKTLPVVCDTDKSTPAEIAAVMTAQLMDSMANDLYSYGEIARNFGINNDVMFIWQGDSFTRDSFCGVSAEETVLPLSDAKAPLSLQVTVSNGNLRGVLDYDPNRYTEDLMSAFLSAFDTACAAFAENRELSSIGLLSPEAEKEMEWFNSRTYSYDRGQTVTGLFLEKAKKYPDKLCVAYKNKRFTYKEADILSGKVAKFLMRKGIGCNDIVPILIHRDENMVITAHGVVRSGAAYLGLDPTYPVDRLRFMINDSGAKYLIADRSLTDKIPGNTLPVLYTDEIAALPDMTESEEAAFREDEKYRVTPDNIALIVYSSGTTGLPKGSLLQHKAVVCFFHNYRRNVEMDEHANVATYASFGFDGGAQDVFSSPMAGASLFVIPDEIRLDLAALERFYVRNAITCGFMTTQVGTMFVSATKCKTLKHFMVGGEKFIPVLAPEWVCLQNGYGPSETMCYVNRFNVIDTGSLQPIGCVSDNIREYIIDKYGNRLPYGACGELCVSGGQLGLGYLNRPEKTAQVFVANPFSRADDSEDYRRMYRTGDVARMLPDGNYDFVGRNDGQVKIRGFRVELSEIEIAIRQFPGITKAVAAAFDNPSGGKFLAAYIVADAPVDIDALKAFIANGKPAYMVPAVIMQLDGIPLTSNGKVNMRKLPKAELGSGTKKREPANETEERICQIFADVLGLTKVYADDDFFAIGGSSISAIQVVVRCEQAGMSVVYKNLFANPTPGQLASFLLNGQQTDISAADLEKGDGYNYDALKYNIPDNLPGIKDNGVGDVLLTGVTGFLGSHVFKELLTATNGRVICLVRGKHGMHAEQRLEMMMMYYFEAWFADELRGRVTVVDGDMEDEKTLETLLNMKFDTVINCAANVKHFAAGDELMGSNFTGVENLITLSEKTGARLIQISSLSVCGESVNGSIPPDFIFKETDMNIGQSLENKYIYSKYLAEQAVIDAVSNKRVRGKIIRLGNLMARFGDSEFQLNANTNGFLRVFIGFAALGCFPLGMMDMPVEFSPIDAVAKAVVKLSGTQDCYTCFHAKNCNTVHYGYFLEAIRRNGKPLEIVEDAEFEYRLSKALEHSEDVEKLGGLLAYRNGVNTTLTDSARFHGKDDGGRDTRVKIASDTGFTVKALYRLGFSWPLISEAYLDKMVEALFGLNIFTDSADLFR